jgi:hypothetical protein
VAVPMKPPIWSLTPARQSKQHQEVSSSLPLVIRQSVASSSPMQLLSLSATPVCEELPAMANFAIDPAPSSLRLCKSKMGVLDVFLGCLPTSRGCRYMLMRNMSSQLTPLAFLIRQTSTRSCIRLVSTSCTHVTCRSDHLVCIRLGLACISWTPLSIRIS